MDEIQTLCLAREAIRQGHKAAGQGLLLQVIRANPRSETAWLCLSAVVDDPAKERACLQRVLEINPRNDIAQRHLARLDQAQASPLQPISEPLTPGSQPIPLLPELQSALFPSKTQTVSSTSKLQQAIKRRSIPISLLALGAVLALVILIGFGAHGFPTFSRLASTQLTPPLVPRFVQSLSEFEKSQFCQVYKCKREDSWNLRSGGVNHTYGINVSPEVMVEISILDETPMLFALHFFSRSSLSSDEFQFIFSFLGSVNPDIEVDKSIQSFIKQNINNDVFQICQANSMPFGEMRIWVGKVVQQIVSIRKSCPQETSVAQKPPTSTPDVSATCQSDAEHYLDQIHPLSLEFSDAVKLAESTPRIALGTIIRDMKGTQRDIESVRAPDCAEEASNLLLKGMDKVIDGFTDFMASKPDATVQRKTSQGFLDMENGLSQLFALALGESTPTPKQLPTNTPIPPTPTPLPVGSPVIADDWEIYVERIEYAEQMTSYGSTIRATGRFALLFLKVTNRGLSPDTFVVTGKLEIRDATGTRYEEDIVATVIAQSQYKTDLGASINPDETRHVVAVFDISRQSSSYVLAPGILADPYSPRVLLGIP